MDKLKQDPAMSGQVDLAICELDTLIPWIHFIPDPFLLKSPCINKRTTFQVLKFLEIKFL